MADVVAGGSPSISAFIQSRLEALGLSSVTAVEAAQWLDQARVLRDSPQRPGKPLRDQLRAGLIAGARREGRFWYVDRLGSATSSASSVRAPEDRQENIRAPVTKRRARASSDEAYVLDLCDELLGEKGLRQHRFPWLVGDAGTTGRSDRLPVDAYYPEAGVVVEYRERQHYEATPFFDRRQTISGMGRGEQRRLYDRRREEEIPKHGLRLLVIDHHELAFDGRGRLLRHTTADREILKRRLRADVSRPP